MNNLQNLRVVGINPSLSDPLSWVLTKSELVLVLAQQGFPLVQHWYPCFW